MPRQCSVCAHASLHAIDKALVAGGTLRDIARQFGLSKDAVARHQADHLPTALVAAVGAEETRQALDVLQQLKTINAAALTVLRDARTAGDGDLALRAIDRIHKQIELQARLLGELGERPVVNILVAPEWHALRGAILAALAPFPEARYALAATIDRGVA